jgi:hypothetical protein
MLVVDGTIAVAFQAVPDNIGDSPAVEMTAVTVFVRGIGIWTEE